LAVATVLPLSLARVSHPSTAIPDRACGIIQATPIEGTGRVKWSKLLIVLTGVALLLPIIYVPQQHLLVLRRPDVLAGVQPLVAIPLGSIPAESPLSKQIAVPSGGWWKRMVKSYGEPKILIAAVNVPINQGGRGGRVYAL